MELVQIRISGLRSFKPTHNRNAPPDQQIIEFNELVTLINGLNGAGKSAIIEALQLITSGQFPSGSNDGHTLYHDPKMERVDSTVGAVTLVLRRLDTGAVVTLTWKGEATKATDSNGAISDSPKIETFGTEIMEYPGQSRSVATLTMRKEVPRILGLNAGILRYVLFCTQADNLWALDEASKLKKAMDKILNLGGDNKELDDLIAKEKQLQKQIQLFEITVKNLKKDFDQLKTKQLELTGREGQWTTSKANLVNVQGRLVEASGQLTKANAVHATMSEIEKEQRFISWIRQHITEELQISIEQIQQTLATASVQGGQDPVVHAGALQAKVDGCNQRLEIFRNEKTKYDLDLENHGQQCRKIEQNVKEIANKLNYQIGEYDCRNLGHLATILQEKLDLARACKIQELEKAANEVQRKKLELETARADQAKLEGEIKAVKKEHSELSSSIANATQGTSFSVSFDEPQGNQSQSQAEIASSQVGTLRQSLNTSRESATRNDQSLEQLRNDADTVQQQIWVLKMETERLKLRKIYEEQREWLEERRRTLSARITNLDLALKRKIDEMAALEDDKTLGLGEKPYEEAVEHFRGRVAELDMKHVRELLDLQFKQVDLQQAKDRAKILQDDLERTLIEFPGHSVDTALAEVTQSLDSYRNTKSKIASQEFLLKALQQFHTPEVQILKQQHKTRRDTLRASPDLEVDVKSLEAQKSQLQELQWKQRANPETLQHLETREGVLEVEKKRIGDILSTKNSFESVLVECDTLSRVLNELRPLLIEFASHKATIESAIRHVDSEKNTSALNRINATVDQLDSSLGELKKEITASAERRRTSETNRDEENRKLQEAELQVEQARRLDQDTARCRELRTRLNDLEKLKAEGATQIPKLEAELLTLQTNLSNLERRLREEMKNWEAKKMEFRQHLAEHDAVEVKRTQFAVRQNASEADKKELQESTVALTALGPEVAALKNLTDNLKLKLSERKITGLEIQLAAELQELGHVGLAQDFTLQAYSSAVQNLEKEMVKASGLCSQLEADVAFRRLELQKQFYTNAATYETEQQKLDAMQLDLSQTKSRREAADKAILDKHLQGLAAINQRLVSLWPTIYNSRDIETVQLKCDPDPKASASADSKYRKQYNYRVVMGCRGGVELDLRDRSSGGQKILANLAIRMALAEVLASGVLKVLAFDDPTSSLDATNTALVVEALANVSRAGFQLVISSQDGDFVQKLGWKTGTGNYYDVERPASTGYSTITRKRLEPEADEAGGSGGGDPDEGGNGPPPRKRRSYGNSH